MSFETERIDRCTVIKVKSGKLNSAISPELKSLISDLTNEGAKNLVLDMSISEYCDSSGLSAILVGNRLCSAKKGLFVISGINDTIQNLINLSRLDSILKITPTVAEAHDLILLNEIENEFNGE